MLGCVGCWVGFVRFGYELGLFGYIGWGCANPSVLRAIAFPFCGQRTILIMLAKYTAHGHVVRNILDNATHWADSAVSPHGYSDKNRGSGRRGSSAPCCTKWSIVISGSPPHLNVYTLKMSTGSNSRICTPGSHSRCHGSSGMYAMNSSMLLAWKMSRPTCFIALICCGLSKCIVPQSGKAQLGA